MIRDGNGARIVMYRGAVPVFRAQIKKVELAMGTLTFTTTDTEVHVTLAGQESWSSTKQHGATRTGIKLSEFSQLSVEQDCVKFTKPPVGKGVPSIYAVEPITD
jgi:hypothetical protein